MKKSIIIAAIAALTVGSPVFANTITLKSNLTTPKNVTITGTGVFTLPNLGLRLQGTGGTYYTTLKQNSNEAANRVLNIPALGADDTIVTLGTAQTVTGVKTFTAIPILPASTVTSANIQTGAAKRQLLVATPCPGGGVAAANTTVYFEFVYPGRAGIVKQITYAHHVDTVSGTNTIKVLKATASGNTMLSTATISTNAVAIDTGVAQTLTATSGDLALTAGQGIYVEYSAGTQGAAAQDETVTIEFEPTDF